MAVALLAACASDHAVNPDGSTAYEVSVATADGEAMMAWHGRSGRGFDAIHIRRLDRQGQPLGEAAAITDGQRYAYEPDLQLAGTLPILAWYEKAPNTGALTGWLAALDDRGRPRWKHRLDAAGGWARNPVIRVRGATLYVAWIETPTNGDGEPAVWTARFKTDGQMLSVPMKAGRASRNSWNLNAAIGPDGRFRVVYDARLGNRANELQLLTIGPESAQQVQLSADDGFASLYPDLGFGAGGHAAMTWFDERDGNQEIYLAMMDLSAQAKPLVEHRISRTEGASIGAYLAWNGARLALVWCETEEGRQSLYGASFDAAGQETVPPHRLARSKLNASIPSIRPFGAGFLVGWNDYEKQQNSGHGDTAAQSVARTMLLP